MVNKFIKHLVVISCISLLVACSDEVTEKKPSPELLLGKELYTKNCKVCHAQGLNGAPIVGNHKMWDERASQGLAILKEHAVNGFGLMPAKGGKTHLSDQEIELVIRYMLSELEK